MRLSSPLKGLDRTLVTQLESEAEDCPAQRPRLAQIGAKRKAACCVGKKKSTKTLEGENGPEIS